MTDEAAAADPTAAKVPEGVFYLTQISDLGNACGTIAMLHGLGNNLDVLSTSGFAFGGFADVWYQVMSALGLRWFLCLKEGWFSLLLSGAHCT